MKKWLFGCWFFFSGIHTIEAQMQGRGDILKHVDEIINVMPGVGGNQYADPTPDDLLVWKDALEELLEENYTEAHTLASDVGYQVTIFTDTTDEEDKEFYLLEKSLSSGNFWGTYIFHMDGCRAQIQVQSPHPKFDTNTGRQAAYIFKELEAGGFFLNGTHRCNAMESSACSGTTSTCGSNGPFRISDVAHNENSVFQLATEVMNKTNQAAIFIQLHGFAKQGTDPEVIFSNGTRITPGKDYIGEIVEALPSIDPSVTSKAGHLHLEWDRLLAFTNTQGRLVNNSIDPCTENATNTSGRFIHIEQSLNKFRIDQYAWDRMKDALEIALPCDEQITALRKADPEDFVVYPNPAEDVVYVSIPTRSKDLFLQFYNTSGVFVANFPVDRSGKIALKNLLTPGMYFYVLISQTVVSGTGKIVIR